MRTIKQYRMKIEPRQGIVMFLSANITSVKGIGGELYLFAAVDTEESKKARYFGIIKCGEDIETVKKPNEGLSFIDTVFIEGPDGAQGKLMSDNNKPFETFHVFELIDSFSMPGANSKGS